MEQIKVTRKGRYKGPKGRFWDHFSDYIRLRDFLRYGTCISCGRKVRSYKDLQAGHYMAAGNCGFALVFNEFNVNGECAGCNAFDLNHHVGYRENLNKRYGEGTAEKLEDMYRDSHFRGKTTKEWTKLEYEIKKEHYKKEIEELCSSSTIQSLKQSSLVSSGAS